MSRPGSSPGSPSAPAIPIRREPAPDQRSAILAAAATLFDDMGYHNASTALIAERADVGKADVYTLFPVKHDILFAIHDEWIDRLLELGRANIGLGISSGDDIRRATRQYILDILHVIHTRPSQVRVYFQSFRDLPPDLQKLAKAKRDMYEAQVEGVIRHGIEVGLFRAQNARVATLGLFGMSNWVLHWYRAGGELPYEQIAVQLGDIFLRGMSIDPAESGVT